MKKIITLCAMLAALSTQAQNVSYSIECVRQDSFFLIETISQSFAGSPRPQEVVTALLFRDTSDLSKFFDRLEVERNDTRSEFDKVSTKMEAMNIRANAIRALRKGGRWMVLPPPPPLPPVVTPPAVPTKKKKKHGKT